MTKLRSLPLCVLASALIAAVCAPTVVFAQQTAPNVRIVNRIDENQLVTLKGNVLPAASLANDRGPVSSARPMQDLVLVLSRSPEQQAAFDAYVESEYDSGSPNFHQWLTADEIGERFGPSLTDIATITNWLASQGFTVSHTAKDRMSITFSGTAGLVENAFHTSIHNLSVNGVAHIANMTNPQIPAALAPVVAGIKQLHDFHPHPLHKVGSVVQFNPELGKWQRSGTPATSAASLSPLASSGIVSTETATPRPLFTTTSNGFVENDVSPNDFAAIYYVQPLWSAGTTGTNQVIAIVGTSDITLSDVSSYKSTFGLQAGSAPIIKAGVNGHDPGVCASTSSTALCGIGDLEENTLDVEVSGAVAPGAQVVLVTSGYNSQTNPTNDPIFDDAQYIEENIGISTSPVYGAHQMSVSYGLCELFEGTSGNVTYYNLWQTAAGEGLAVFVASGDSGSPACDQGLDGYGNPYSAQYGLAVSGLASTPFNTAVGGTDFSWCQPAIVQSGSNAGGVTGCGTSNSTPYWNSSNASNNSNAKGYVPEIPWNDTCENPIWAKYIQTVASFLSNSAGTTPEQACNFIQNDWYQIYQAGNPVLAGLVDTVGGGGGQSNCVVNNADTVQSNPACTKSATSVNTGSSTVTLSGDGWQVPSWQTGVTGTSGLTSRAIPDVSFFAGDGGLDSATLVCLAAVGGACTSSTVANTALEIGGTSVASPEMAGVMALINQKWGAQGLPNKALYQLAGKQNYSSCSSESVSTSS
ncbi:MAG TPA: protease pro-enzyme activation domain-containing protein, partial [Terracidiphilus sp.]|nr:protease pro-enzyme activation domain-containing protein [Terracidiphilus sp.]